MANLRLYDRICRKGKNAGFNQSQDHCLEPEKRWQEIRHDLPYSGSVFCVPDGFLALIQENPALLFGESPGSLSIRLSGVILQLEITANSIYWMTNLRSDGLGVAFSHLVDQKGIGENIIPLDLNYGGIRKYEPDKLAGNPAVLKIPQKIAGEPHVPDLSRLLGPCRRQVLICSWNLRLPEGYATRNRRWNPADRCN